MKVDNRATKSPSRLIVMLDHASGSSIMADSQRLETVREGNGPCGTWYEARQMHLTQIS